MSKAKNTEGKVPSTKIAPPTVIKCTKTQRELFIMKRDAANAGIKIIVDEYNKQSSENLGKIVDAFIEELKIDVENENWSFDAQSVQFTKQEKKGK
ncbi:hypothetical protein LCGC14_2060610 [marine sediment metagenome]|uniref:Uncharacterized protein n=1 Tax=marine sediment metagenome TaxID=412755 RepID=A0A0F9HI83_9ZZZZ